MVPCVVGYPSPPRPCGSMCCGLSLPPPVSKARGLAWGGGGAHVGTATVLRMTCDCLLGREAWLAGGAYHGGWGGGGPAMRHHILTVTPGARREP